MSDVFQGEMHQGGAYNGPTRQRTYTERDVILAKQEGWALAKIEEGWPEEKADRLAALTYPMPAITRPRVVRDHCEVEWRSIDGQLEFRRRSPNNEWMPLNAFYDDLQPRVRLWADLLDNPTEEVTP